jgi:hypothetical protein
VGNHILRGNFDDLYAQVNSHHLLDEGNQQNQTGAFYALELAKSEDHRALVLSQNSNGCHYYDQATDHDDGKDERH